MIFRILLLINLISCVSGTFVVNVTQTSYQAEENHNITLEWTFTVRPDRSPSFIFIYCELITDHSVLVLYSLHNGIEVPESQHQQFSGRVQFDKDVLSEGRIRLQLSRLRTNDSGLYLCKVRTIDGWSSERCRLNVTAAWPKAETDPDGQNTTRWGRFGLYCGLVLTAAPALSVCSNKMEEKKNKKTLTEKSSESCEPSTSSQMSEAESKGLSCVSMKSDRSKYQPPHFIAETLKCQVSEERSHCSVHEEDLKDPVLFMCGKKNLKKAMQEKFSLKSEGNSDKESSMKSIFTALFITNRESEGPHEEHPLRHIDRKLKKQHSNNDSVSLSDIFKSLPGQEKPHRTVLTKGVAGIGKSFAVQKFILDWSEEEANQDIDFVFCLSFRELNLSRGEKSLHQLLTEFHPVLCDLKDSENYIKSQITVILDGLDESRLQLDFDDNKVLKSVSEVTSLSNLLVNLIQGNLLPDAHLWITSRPTASSQIPAKYVDMVTEIRGFSDLQKQEYFRRRLSHDLSLAARIVSHVQSSQSLHIMCQIPIFCWISAVLFEEVFRGDEKEDIPQTLTEMMAHFVFVQTKRRSRKYDKTTEENKEKPLKTYREFLLKLGKLAFVHLQKNNLIFYETDLEDCGIDIKEASIYSGFCDTVLREEEIFSQKKVFFFVHLTVQEFFAALFVFDCFTNNNIKELGDFLNLKDKEQTLLDLLKMTVDKVIERKNGHLDFFLRFLLGLVVEPNRRVLHGLLTSPDQSQDTDKKILTYLKSIQRKILPPDSCINLFQTMVEMRDDKVKTETQEYLKLSDRSKTELTPLT
ncbi:protein NLRC3-like [Anabas testudineus]|uniref:protein NLRC3-like n=1 Tax=Anabas testudineus TaxID=64144 RepID=UPI000E458168|nr:protein NLRC3-like [Anabas testudineus]